MKKTLAAFNLHTNSSQKTTPKPLYIFAIVTAVCCYLLLFIGGLVTSHAAGLSVPDWPTSYGWNMFTFPMKDWVGNIFYEHTHRLFASFVGFLILSQAILLQWKEPRRWVKRLGWLALGGVILQGVLGGLTVLFYLPPAISSAHAGLGQAMFCITLAIAMVTSKKWDDNVSKRPAPRRFDIRTLSLITAIAIFCQLLIGAVMRHTFSGLAIPTFPFAPNGSLIPEFTSFGVAINFTHRVGAAVVSLFIFGCARAIFRYHSKDRQLFIAGMLSVFLLGVQIMLGAITIWSKKAITPTTLHVSCGAAILGTMVFIMVRSRHLFAALNTHRTYATEGTNAIAPLVSIAK
ncbi:MAG TPA: COX15/CtaA family protein [Candidatus Kapabacteria bacterium]|jgi:cytochrome c oxidase assembly protein subunit 15|nr:COX15/CtaA family protein [Candidatus Kapabacteria bacterium]